jgi:DNA polymerase-3 subunit alpha
MVEGYRERIFKGGGGKVAFFTLEDQSGRVEVKVRQQQIETYAAVLTSNEPVLVSGKVSFPQQEDSEEGDAGPREPTLLLDEAVPLADAIRAETKQVRIRLLEQRDRREHIDRLRDVLRQNPGACSVALIVQLKDGSEADLLLGREYRVEPSDGMLARLEKLFGEKVAELR